MAWIEKRPKKNGTTYLVRWLEPSGKVVSSTRRTYDEARAFKAEMETAIAKGQYVALETRKMPFGEYAKMVLDSDFGLGRATRANYDTCLRLQLGELAYIPIELVDPGRVRSLFAKLSVGEASPHTLHMTKKVLSRVCSEAVSDGILNRNPAGSVSVPKPARRQMEPLTPQEVQNVSEAVTRRWKAAVLLAAWGGLRIGEVGALTRDDVDWERGSVRINKSQGRYGLKEAKTAASNRVIVLPGWVMRELAAHVMEFAAPDGRLFVTTRGHSINAMTIAPIMRKVGVRFHDLRHTQAALLIKAGAHPREIMERMGHANINITMTVYGHLYPGAHDQLARTLEQYEPKMGEVIEL